MALTVTIVWGGSWAESQPWTPDLFNGILAGTVIDLEGSLSEAQKPSGGIDSTWLGATVFSGLTVRTPDGVDLVPFHDVASGLPGVCTITNLLALGLGAVDAVGSVAATDESLVRVGGVAKRLAIREMAKAAAQYIIPDTAAGTTWTLAHTLVTHNGTDPKSGTLAEVTSPIISGQSSLASADLDPAADELLIHDASAAGTNKHKRITASALLGAANTIKAWGLLRPGTTVTDIGLGAVNTTTNVITTSAAHGLSVGNVVWLPTTVGDLNANTPYYVQEVIASDQITLSDSPGGAVKDLSLTFSGSHALYKWATNPLTAGSGIASIIRISQQAWRIYLSTAQADTSYAVFITGSLTSGGTGTGIWEDNYFTTRTTSMFGVVIDQLTEYPDFLSVMVLR